MYILIKQRQPGQLDFQVSREWQACYTAVSGVGQISEKDFPNLYRKVFHLVFFNSIFTEFFYLHWSKMGIGKSALAKQSMYENLLYAYIYVINC